MSYHTQVDWVQLKLATTDFLFGDFHVSLCFSLIPRYLAWVWSLGLVCFGLGYLASLKTRPLINLSNWNSRGTTQPPKEKLYSITRTSSRRGAWEQDNRAVATWGQGLRHLTKEPALQPTACLIRRHSLVKHRTAAVGREVPRPKGALKAETGIFWYYQYKATQLNNELPLPESLALEICSSWLISVQRLQASVHWIRCL